MTTHVVLLPEHVLSILKAGCRAEMIDVAEEARINAEKEELERKEQEKKEAAERLIRENEVQGCSD